MEKKGSRPLFTHTYSQVAPRPPSRMYIHRAGRLCHAATYTRSLFSRTQHVFPSLFFPLLIRRCDSFSLYILHRPVLLLPLMLFSLLLRALHPYIIISLILCVFILFKRTSTSLSIFLSHLSFLFPCSFAEISITYADLG